jgi:hypothetical protein
MLQKPAILSAILIIIAITTIFAGSQSENRLRLESDIRILLKENYLHKRTSLQDNQTWLSIELKEKTWHNPNDTKALVNSVLSHVKKYMPLVSGFPVDEITIIGDFIEPLNYTFNNYRQKGKKKVYGSSSSSKNIKSNNDAILRVPNAKAVLIAIDEESYQEFCKVSTRNDYDLLTRLILNGQLIETGNNIRIKIVKYGILKHKVKILEGLNTGQVGWVAVEFVKK